MKDLHADGASEADSEETATGVAIQTRRPSRLRRIVSIVVASAVFAASGWYIATNFEWHGIGRALRDVNYVWLILGGGLTIIVYWVLRALRWHVLLIGTGTRVPAFDLYMATAVALSLAPFTPLQSGEVLKIELLKKNAVIGRATGYGSFLVERGLDLAVLLTLALVSLLTTVDILPSRTYALYGLVILAAVAVVLGLLLWKVRPKGRMRRLLHQTRRSIRNVPTLIVVFLLTCASWASVAIGWQVVLYSASIHLDFFQSAGLVAIVALAAILTLVPGGLGISEAGASEILQRLAVPTATAQGGSLLIRFYSIIPLVLGAAHLAVWVGIRRRRGTDTTQPPLATQSPEEPPA